MRRRRQTRVVDPAKRGVPPSQDSSWAVCTPCARHVAVAWVYGRKDTLPCPSPTATRRLAFDPAGCRGLDQPPARRRLVPPTLRDELRDSACADIATAGRGIGPTYPTRRMSAGSAAPTRQTSLAVDNSRSQTIFGSFAPSQSLRRLVRQGEVAHPPGLGTNRRTCHPHAEKDRRHPRLAPAGRVRTRAQHQGRGREAPALGTKARGQVRIRRGGGASWLAAALRRYVQARVCRSAPCRPRTAAVVAADGAAGVPCAFASWLRLARS